MPRERRPVRGAGSGGGRPPHTTAPLPLERAILWTPRGVTGGTFPEGLYPLFLEHDLLAGVNRHLDRIEREPRFGFLLGRLYHCPETDVDYAVADTAVAAREILSEEASGAYIIRAWSEAQAVFSGHSGLLLGWYHSHYRFGLMPTEADRDTISRYFDAPWQLSIIVVPDRARPLGAVFRTLPAESGGDHDRPAAFYELSPGPHGGDIGRAHSAVTWANYQAHPPAPPVFGPAEEAEEPEAPAVEEVAVAEEEVAVAEAQQAVVDAEEAVAEELPEQAEEADDKEAAVEAAEAVAEKAADSAGDAADEAPQEEMAPEVEPPPAAEEPALEEEPAAEEPPDVEPPPPEEPPAAEEPPDVEPPPPEEPAAEEPPLEEEPPPEKEPPAAEVPPPAEEPPEASPPPPARPRVSLWEGEAEPEESAGVPAGAAAPEAASGPSGVRVPPPKTAGRPGDFPAPQRQPRPPEPPTPPGDRSVRGVPLVMPGEKADMNLLPPRSRRIPWRVVATGAALVAVALFLLWPDAPTISTGGPDPSSAGGDAVASPELRQFLEDVDALEIAGERYDERAADFDAGRIGCDLLTTGYVAADEAYVRVAAGYGNPDVRSNPRSADAYEEAGAEIADINGHFDGSGCPRP